MTRSRQPRKIAIMGGGPAGLMAAEAASGAGVGVEVYDAMASCGRKFLVAGKGGLNLTHRDRDDALLAHYGERCGALAPALRAFDGEAIRHWAGDLGIATFVGSSGRVFPADLKAAPLLRRWLERLRAAGVRFHPRHRFLGWDEQGRVRVAAPEGEQLLTPAATVLALGGASWPRLGSDGGWVAPLADDGIEINPLRAANCGFECHWSDYLRTRFAGVALKSVGLGAPTLAGSEVQRKGEFLITEYGVEGSLIYALSRHLREVIARDGKVTVQIDLAPDRDRDALAGRLAGPRGKRTLAHHLKQHAGIAGLKLALLHELHPPAAFSDPLRLAAAIKATPLTLHAPRPLAQAISSAGGVRFEMLDEHYMLRRRVGVFVAGEMLDWEAPTGGYLLTACLATGRAAGSGALRWVLEGAEGSANQHRS